MLGWSKKYENQILAGCAVLESDRKVLENINNTLFAIPLNKVEFNDGIFSNEDGNVHIKYDGTYLVTGKVVYNADPSEYGARWIAIRKNGTNENITEATAAPNSTTGGMSVNATAVLKLKAGDYLELFGGIGGSPEGSTAKNLIAYADWTKLAVIKLAD